MAPNIYSTEPPSGPSVNVVPGWAPISMGIVSKLPLQSRTIIYNAGKFVLGLAVLLTALAAIVPANTKTGALIAGAAAMADGLAGLYLRMTTTTPIGASTSPAAADENTK